MTETPPPPTPTPEEAQALFEQARKAAEAVLRERAETDPKAKAALAAMAALGEPDRPPET